MIRTQLDPVRRLVGRLIAALNGVTDARHFALVGLVVATTHPPFRWVPAGSVGGTL